MKAAVYDGAEGALALDANERSKDKPGASYMWALVIGSMIRENGGEIIFRRSVPEGTPRRRDCDNLSTFS